MDGPHPQVAEIADKLMSTTFETTQLAALASQKAGDGGKIDAIYVAAVGAIGCSHVLASLLGHHGDPDRPTIELYDVNHLVNPTSTLLAAILCHSMAPVSKMMSETGQGANIECRIEFSPTIMLDSIQQVERITGRPVRGQINELMLRSLRRLSEESDTPMSRFMAQRRATPGNTH